MKRLAYITMPLWMATFCFGVVCLTSGVDLSIERNGDRIKVFTTNNTYRCAMFEWNTTLATNGWSDFHGYWAGSGERPMTDIVFETTASNQRAFWRLRDCANP